MIFEFSENQEVGFKKDIVFDKTLKYSGRESAETLTSSHLFSDTRPTLVNTCNIGGSKSSRICRIKCRFVIQKTLSMRTWRWALGCNSSRKLGPLPRPSKSGALD
jgi:hypothetical protein